MRITSFALISLWALLLASCTSSSQDAAPIPDQSHASTTHLVMRASTPNPGDNGDFFIRWDVEDGEVSVGDTIDIAEKGGRNISIKVKSILDSAGEYQKATKWQLVSIYFDGDKSLYDTVSMDAYLVEKWGRYPMTQAPTPELKLANLTLKWKINGQDWEGKSMMNPPPYYKYGSRAMMSPDTPIFKMSFFRESDSSSVNFDLKGELKVASYQWNTLYLNFSGNKGTTESKTGDNIRVEITSYAEEGSMATISGKITGSISDTDRGTTTLDLEWKDARIDVWWMEAK